MEPTYISWTPTNWLTVFLMAFGGFIIVKFVLAIIKKQRVGAANA